ncbi:MAG: hypothetical protein ACFE0Q_14870 [Anaerolineae bacterium]
MMDNYAQEIHDLHQFFEDYLVGRRSHDPMTRFTGVTDDHFTIVGSDGTVMNRDAIIGYVRDNYSKRPNFSIWTEQVSLRQHLNGILIVTYEEWQTIDSVTTVRTSTVAFAEDDQQPNGLRWLHVHESGLRTVRED